MALVSPQTNHNYWGSFATTADLPNSASNIQSTLIVEAGDHSYVVADTSLYVCTDPGTAGLGDAAWAQVDSAAVAPILNFRPVAADFGAAIFLSGSLTASSITDIASGTAAFTNLPYDLLQIDLTDPSAGTVVRFPITLPADFSTLPERFSLEFILSHGAAPPDVISAGVSFSNSGYTVALNSLDIFDPVTPATTPGWTGGAVGISPTVSWTWPSDTYGNSMYQRLDFDSVQPFAAFPQIEMTNTRMNLVPTGEHVARSFLGSGPSSGDLSTDFVGETLEDLSLYFFISNAFVGTASFVGTILLKQHPRDTF